MIAMFKCSNDSDVSMLKWQHVKNDSNVKMIAC
jgi:hypothetical protein